MEINTLINMNVQEKNSVKLQGIRHNTLKIFECPQCGSIFDRASQLDYHHRSIHLGERSQICQICEKGFFRKADLRTHLNIHLGTNFHICEICGRKFSHISNLIRHCRMHTGIKPYSCVICDKSFTQVSSLARHRQMIHGIPKESMNQYCNPSLINNKSQVTNHALKENKFVKVLQELITKRQCYCKSCGGSFKCVFCSKVLLRQHEKCHSESTVLSPSNSCKKTIDDNIESRYEIYVEPKCLNQCRDSDVQKNDIIFNRYNNDMDNKASLQTAGYVTSKQDNLVENESTNRLSQVHIAELEERLGSADLPINKNVVSNSSQDTVNNHEQIQSKDSISYLHQLDKNNFTFLPRDRGPNIELNTQNDENILRSSDSGMCTVHEICKETCTNDIKKPLDTDTNLQTCNSNEVSANQKFLHKQISAEDIINENRKYSKLLNDDDNQLYIELSDSGMLKFDESRYCNNADSVSMNLGHTIKSQPLATAANDAIYTPVGMQNQDNLLQNEDNLENFNNLSNIVLNNEEPMLRLVQTDTGEQFYEFIMNNLVEKMQNASCIKDLESKVEEPSSTFRYCPKMELSPKESNEKRDQSDRIEHQEALESLTDINNEFNYTQLDFHGEGKNFTALCHDESENFQQNSKGDGCADNIQEKSMQAYNSANLELLENESHVDFDKYVETNLEALDKLNYENCNERFLEFVEVADIGIESSGFKESSMIRLIQSDGEQLLELLQDSQIAEQESNQDFLEANNLDKDCSNVLQDSDKIADCPKSKSDFFAYVEHNVLLEENINNHNRSVENNEEHVDSDNHLYANIMTGEGISNEKCNETSEKPKKLKAKDITKKFQCTECKKAFSTSYNYKQHIGIHFTDQQKFHCKDCGVSFAWKSTLNKHIANNHSSDGPQKFVCEICPKVYSTLSQVNEHVKRDHLKQRNHVCSHCGKSFFKRFDLKIHSRTHTNERPYVCGVCGKRFHHQSHIIRHERTHSGKRPYVCDVCQKTFTQPSSLKAHKQKHQQIRMDFLDYQIDEDDPNAPATF